MLCPRVHLKCAVVDSRWAYTGSANLTGAGVGAKSGRRRNFESGIITTDPAIVDRVMEQFDGIWRGSHCKECDRKGRAMPMKCYGYLDIETTGLSRRYADLTVVGIATVTGTSLQVAQLYGGQIDAAAVGRLLEPVDEVYTYNGSRFDLPFIKHKLGLDVKGQVAHTDLMYDCWRRNLKGGLKAVEKRLGISRKLPEVNGYMAVQLWWQYLNDNNPAALQMLLTYNREDIVNLDTLRKKLGVG